MNVDGKRFLVTGGTGFIGSALVRGLLRSGARARSRRRVPRLPATACATSPGTSSS